MTKTRLSEVHFSVGKAILTAIVPRGGNFKKALNEQGAKQLRF